MALLSVIPCVWGLKGWVFGVGFHSAGEVHGRPLLGDLDTSGLSNKLGSLHSADIDVVHARALKADGNIALGNHQLLLRGFAGGLQFKFLAHARPLDVGLNLWLFGGHL